jgi:hypothetical protein
MVVDHDDCAHSEVLLHPRKVGEEKLATSVPRRPCCRRRNTIDGEDLGVGRTAEPESSDVCRLVPCGHEQFDDDRRLVLIEQEPHAEGRSGSARSCTATAA